MSMSESRPLGSTRSGTQPARCRFFGRVDQNSAATNNSMAMSAEKKSMVYPLEVL